MSDGLTYQFGMGITNFTGTAFSIEVFFRLNSIRTLTVLATKAAGGSDPTSATTPRSAAS